MAKDTQPAVVAQTVMLPISKIENNKGQVEGLPSNPRLIKNEQYEALKKSIQDAPEMLTLRELLVYPHDGKYVVIGGNMRLKVLRELGEKQVPCKIIPEDTPVEKLREYTIKDNTTGGMWDWDALANEWDEQLLNDWGMKLPQWNEEDFSNDFGVLNDALKNASDKCQLTLLIPIEEKEKVADYIKKNGKDKIVTVVLNEIRNA